MSKNGSKPMLKGETIMRKEGRVRQKSRVEEMGRERKKRDNEAEKHRNDDTDQHEERIREPKVKS